MARKSRGRQKLAMVKIPNESNLMVTFSKRRTGLFKKASELSTLCGAEVAIIVFSPGRKAFSFGHPFVEKVLDRFANGSFPQNSGAFQLIEAHRNARVRDLNMQLTQVLNLLEMEKKQGEELERMRKLSQRQCWWENPIEDLDLAQLEQLKSSLQGLRQNVAKQVEQVLIRSSNPPQQLITGDSSGNVIVPYDARNARVINTNMHMPPPPHVNTNMTMATFNPNMNMSPPINSNMNMNYVYNLGYGNGFF